ncbi:hypothetical protein Hanom_Chr07g00603611 [Helianthus anomalus]
MYHFGLGSSSQSTIFWQIVIEVFRIRFEFERIEIRLNSIINNSFQVQGGISLWQNNLGEGSKLSHPEISELGVTGPVSSLHSGSK